MIESNTDREWFSLPDLSTALAVTLGLALIAAALPSLAEDSRDKRANAPAREARALQAFTQKMRSLYPQTRIDEVKPTETPGLYEVVMGPNIAYIDASARYWTFGHRYDMVERRDLTAPRIAEAGKLDTATLPVEAALKTVKGNGRRVLYIFADPNCGYCKQFERSLSQLKDATVYTFMLPILSQDSVDKANAVWCAPDRDAAWRAWMLDGVVPAPSKECATPTDQVTAMARRLRIEATPTLVAADGRKAPGAMPAEDLIAWLDAGSPGNAARSVSVKTQAAPN